VKKVWCTGLARGREREKERDPLAIMFIEGNSGYMGNIEIY
jgi:hypothetical protein